MPTETDSLRLNIRSESGDMTSVRSQLLSNFRNKEYRHAFVEEKVRTSIAAQVKAIREQRDIKRPELAAMMNRAPSWIFRLEDPNQPPPTITTLLQVAAAFDTDLTINFGRFSNLLRYIDGMTPDSFEVPSFDEECEQSAFEERKPPTSQLRGDWASQATGTTGKLAEEQTGSATVIDISVGSKAVTSGVDLEATGA